MEPLSLGLPSAAAIVGETGLADLRRIAGSTGAKADSESRTVALRKAAEQFEAIFIRLLMREMRRTVAQSDLFGSSANEKEIYDEIADSALAEGLGKHGSLGIADMVVRQLGEKYAQPLTTESFLAQRDRYSG